jgi:hypothetical protein
MDLLRGRLNYQEDMEMHRKKLYNGLNGLIITILTTEMLVSPVAILI